MRVLKDPHFFWFKMMIEQEEPNYGLCKKCIYKHRDFCKKFSEEIDPPVKDCSEYKRKEVDWFELE
jgi:predicted amidophosphoribosyltransferase